MMLRALLLPLLLLSSCRPEFDASSTITSNAPTQQQRSTTTHRNPNHHHHHHYENEHLIGETSAVYDLLDRILRNQEHPFVLKIAPLEDKNKKDQRLYFHLKDYDGEVDELVGDESFPLNNAALKRKTATATTTSNSTNKILITASTASELTAGIGWYLWNYCNMTYGWKRGGGSQMRVPSTGWPRINETDGIAKERAVPWSYFMVSRSKPHTIRLRVLYGILSSAFRP